MKILLAPFALSAALLSGCGVDVASTAAVSGVVKAEEARQATQTKQQVEKKLDAAMQTLQQRQPGGDPQ